ncbi:MAG: hypothetical protein M0R28_04690 [Pigmentiphaga sp.]|nr:hypothetical protein [Pigmentiphaga sp.]
MVYSIFWTYENGRLAAHDDRRRLLLSAEAEGEVGEQIAHLLNQAPMLSKQLIPPVIPLPDASLYLS